MKAAEAGALLLLESRAALRDSSGALVALLLPRRNGSHKHQFTFYLGKTMSIATTQFKLYLLLPFL